MTPTPFELEDPGVFYVRYEDGAALAPERQQTLRREIGALASKQPVALVMLVDTVSTLPFSEPTAWLEFTRSLAPGLKALAVVSKMAGVRAATYSFGALNVMSGVPVSIAAFATEGEARLWTSEQVGRRN